MLKNKRTLTKMAYAIGAGAILATMPLIGQAAWEPQKPVEFVVMAGKGGGADKAVQVPPRKECLEDDFSIVLKGRRLGKKVAHVNLGCRLE